MAIYTPGFGAGVSFFGSTVFSSATPLNLSGRGSNPARPGARCDLWQAAMPIPHLKMVKAP
jgi:hypothetical protein